MKSLDAGRLNRITVQLSNQNLSFSLTILLAGESSKNFPAAVGRENNLLRRKMCN